MTRGPKLALALAAAMVAIRLALMAFAPVFDPSEARYAAISANMARSGDFTVPYFTHRGLYQSFDGKPPLVFQAGGLFCRLFNASSPAALQFSVRLFPFLSALAVLAILFAAVRRRAGRSTASLAVAIAATSTAFYAAAGVSMTDMTLTAAVAGALLAHWAWVRDDEPSSAVAWGGRAAVAALLGVGMITKGPVAIVMYGLPVFADAVLCRRWRVLFDWRWLAVAPVFLLIAAPWFVLVEIRNPGSVWYFFYNENFLRFVTHDYGDRYGAGREAFRGVSVLWALVATLPWSLVPAVKLAKGYRALRLSRIPALLRESFPLLALFSITAFWCLTSRVLIYYLFPVIPLFAAWMAEKAEVRLLKRLVLPAAAITLIVTIGALLGGAAFSDKMLGRASPQTWGYSGRYSHEFYHGTAPECRGAGVNEETYRARRKAARGGR